MQVACHAREDARRGEDFETKRQRFGLFLNDTALLILSKNYSFMAD